MADIQGMFKEAWSKALVGVNAAEQEAEKVLSRLAEASWISPDEVRRHAREFGERLQTQRRELEKAIDDAVRKAASRLKIPAQSDIDALKERLDRLTEAVERLSSKKGDG